MKKKTKVVLLLCLFVLLPVLSGYFLLAFYYREGFCLNTWINGVYCTGKTVEEVNEELLDKTEAPIVVITDKKGENYSIDLKIVGYEANYLTALNRYMEEQNPLLWIDNVTFHRNHELVPMSFYDKELLREVFESFFFVKNEERRDADYLLVRNWTDGYFVFDGLSNRLDVDKAFTLLTEAIDAGIYELDLRGTDAYFDMPMNKEQEKTKKLWEKVEQFQNCDLVYDMGDKEIVFNSVLMADFLKTNNGELVLDESGELVLDLEKTKGFIDALAEEYDTYGKEREFLSTRGDVITVQGGTYGTEIDREAEYDFLAENLLSDTLRTGDKQLHIPAYTKEGRVRGKNDIGTTYIEIDMTEQKMYYYQEGELVLETEVVTGNTSRHMGTPEGVNFVYNKEKNRVLRGRNYASFVKFWMPVKGNYGIHDASWRQNFGGTIYQKNGSHGCVNTPSDKMALLYELTEIGTPVVMFY